MLLSNRTVQVFEMRDLVRHWFKNNGRAGWHAVEAIEAAHVRDEVGTFGLEHLPDRLVCLFHIAMPLGIGVHIETSETTREGLGDAIAIAKATDATSVRCYPRYEARVSEINAKTISDLKQLVEFDPEATLLFTLEQHEDLTSPELVHIIESVGNPTLSLLFDFGNMVNAHERPLEALATQSAHITQVHIKDCWVTPDRGGWAQLGCVSGTGHLPFSELLLGLLLLGEDAPQVTAFALEEEADYFAPAMRFPNEEDDPLIKFRTSSLPPGEDAGLDERLQRERDEAVAQVAYVRGLLDQFEQAANETAAKAKTVA